MPNVRVREIISKHMWLDSRKEDKKLNPYSNEINQDYHKKRMSTCGRVLDEKCNLSSSMDSTKSESKMSRTDLYSHANMAVVFKNCTVLN